MRATRPSTTAIWKVSLLPVLCWAVVATGATGDILLEYQASTGVTPETQGWKHEGRSLNDECPDYIGRPDCWWQGAQDKNGDTFYDNNCLFGTGCNVVDEHYNSPTEQLGTHDCFYCTYTEWVVFDDGDNSFNRLTIPDASDATSSVRVVDTPPYGGNLFAGAPAAYDPLRLSTGSGSDLGKVLPTETSVNERNGGKIKIRKSYDEVPGVTNYTLVMRFALGPWGLQSDEEFAQFRILSDASARRWQFGLNINNVPGDVNEGKIGVSDSSFPPAIYQYSNIDWRRYDDQTETWSGGRFYTIHLIARSDGSFTTYLNNDPWSAQHGSIGTPSNGDQVRENNDSDTELQFGMIDAHPFAGGETCGDDPSDGCGKTMWIDYVQVLEGEVAPSCADPPFDVNNDGDIDAADLNLGNLGFLACATGPAPSQTAYDALPWQCRCQDINQDNAIDGRDFGYFQRCLTAGGGAIDPACDD